MACSILDLLTLGSSLTSKNLNGQINVSFLLVQFSLVTFHDKFVSKFEIYDRIVKLIYETKLG